VTQCLRAYLISTLKSACRKENCSYMKLINILICLLWIIGAGVGTASITSDKLRENLLEVAQNSDTYKKPLRIDLVSDQVNGINKNLDKLSEPVPAAYMFAYRRQTDSLVKQAYALLPSGIRAKYAFVSVDRFMQNADAYYTYLLGKEKVVLFEDFKGIGDSTTYTQEYKDIHNLSLKRIETSLKFFKKYAVTTKLIIAMGDSVSSYGPVVRGILEAKTKDLCTLYSCELSWSWGADELPLMAFANALPKLQIHIKFSNPKAIQHYDGLKPLDSVTFEKLANLNMEYTSSTTAPIHSVILSRMPNKSVNDWDHGADQIAFDNSFITSQWNTRTKALKNKTIFIDSRIFNGAWSSQGLPKDCDALAFASWGTTGNKVGAGLAIGKILYFAKKDNARRQLYLEAFAHDVYANGYKDAQRGTLRNAVNSLGIPFNHWAGYQSVVDVNKVFNEVNYLVNKRMGGYFKGTTCIPANTKFKFTPQLWRTFESEVHMTPAIDSTVKVIGVYAKIPGLVIPSL